MAGLVFVAFISLFAAVGALDLVRRAPRRLVWPGMLLLLFVFPGETLASLIAIAWLWGVALWFSGMARGPMWLFRHLSGG